MSENVFVRKEAPSGQDFLSGGGQMGELIRHYDWSQTSLGPSQQWPNSLKTIVRIMLTSQQPIWIGWGKELIKLYNDPYRAIVGGKHPWALGQPASVVWRDIWEAVGPRLEKVMKQNEGTYDEALLLIMERNGYPEETYYTFSYSPVPDDEGGIGGIFCANTDDTQRIIGERQLALLRELASRTVNAKSLTELYERSAESLETNLKDLPFALFYETDSVGQSLVLQGTAGLGESQELAPARIDKASQSFWPFGEVMDKNKTILVNDLTPIRLLLPRGAWDIAPHQAAVVPIAQSGHSGQAGLLVVGLNPYRLFDEGYQGFINLIAGQMAASIADVLAFEEARKRAEALAEIDRAKTVFFSNVSHEFRTPLTLMLGPLEDLLAEEENLLPSHRSSLSLAHRNALRLQKLVNTLLDFSRIEAGRIEARFRPVNLSQFTADLASNFRSAIEKAGLQLTIACLDLPEPMYIDPGMWEKIVLNLLSNAYKHTFEGEIKVATRWLEDRMELLVSDTGIGVEPEQLPNLFKRFHRVPQARSRSHEGSGIGLALVQELVKLHGGTIAVESIFGQGTTFTVSLPAGKAHLPSDKIEAATGVVSGIESVRAFVEEASGWSPEPDEMALGTLAHPAATLPAEMVAESAVSQHPAARIVIADDNPDMRQYLRRLLSPHYQVEVVPDGRAALESIQAQPPDLLLSDIMMPRMDGFTLLAALRADAMLQSVPVILLSARAGEEAKVEGLQAGADDYLTKPFTARELLARVRVHLDMARLRKQKEEAVQAERKLLYNLLMNAPASVAVISGLELVFEFANAAYEQLLGKRNLLGKPLREAVPDISPQLLEIVNGVAFGGERFVTSEIAVELDWEEKGEAYTRYFTMVYEPLFTEEKPDGLVCFAFEVTQQVLARQQVEAREKEAQALAEELAAANEEIQSSNEELHVTNEQLNAANELLQATNEQLAKVNVDLDNFVYAASHDLKSPVNSLQGLLGLLGKRIQGTLDERGRQIMELIGESIHRLNRTIQDLTLIGKVQRNTEEEKEMVCFPELLEDVKADLKELLEVSQADLQIDFQVDSVFYPRQNLRSVLYNLLSNALKYRSLTRKAIVRIQTYQQAGKVVLRVQDNGLGLSDKQQQNLFTMFKRFHDHVEGSGVGLYMIKRMLENNGGSIQVESLEGQGTTFIVQL